MPDPYLYPCCPVGAGLDLLRDPLRAALVGEYSPSASHKTLADIPEITGDGYTAGGLPLKGRAWKDWVLTADPLVWPEASIEGATGVVVYRVGGPLLCYVPLGKRTSSTDGEFRVEWPTDGIMRFRE